MKAYLSSYRIPVPEALFALLPAPPAKTRMAIIPNAGDYYAELARRYKINEKIAYMQDLGFRPDVVDLRDYEAAALEARLAGYEFIWVSGGNTFNLRYEMRRSGFDRIIKGLVERGTVYGGESAGAVVAGPTLRGVEFADEPEFAPEQIYDGLGLIEQIVIPHAGSPMFGDAIDKMIDLYRDDPRAVVLGDNQAFVIDGPRSHIITEER